MTDVIHLISGGDRGGAKTSVLSLLDELRRVPSVNARLAVLGADSGISAEAAKLGIELIPQPAFNNAFKSADILHSHGSRANFTAISLGVGAKRVSTIHSDYRRDYMGSPLRDITFGAINRLSLRRMDHLVCVSEDMAGLCIDRGFAPSRVSVAYNGLRFDPLPEIDRVREFAALGITPAPDDIFVACAARMDPVKDLETLIRGFALAAGRDSRLRLIVFGDGVQRKKLEALANDLCPGRVTFAGWRNNPEVFFQLPHINALTSLHETFGYVLAEGARAKRPAVATNVGGIPDVVEHGKSGLLFDKGDAGRFAEHLLTLAADPVLRARMGEALHAHCLGKFSAENGARTHAEVYSRLLSRKSKGVTVCGAFGMGNIGDEAILGSLLEDLRETAPDMPVTVFSREPKSTRGEHRVDAYHMFNIPKFWSSLGKSALYINGGGNLIQDATSRRSLSFHLFTFGMAKLRRAKILMYACGIGTLTRKSSRRSAARVIARAVDGITLRESFSEQELRRLGVRVPVELVTADLALSASPSGLSPQSEPYICISARKWRGGDGIAAAFSELVDRAYADLGLETLVVNFDENDAKIDLPPRPYLKTVSSVNYRDALAIIGGAKAVVGMRLHSLVFAARMGVPAVGVSYERKVSDFVRYLGDGECVPLAELGGISLIDPLRRAVERGAADPAALGRMLAAEAGNAAVLKKFTE